jgi:hypothetical protein
MQWKWEAKGGRSLGPTQAMDSIFRTHVIYDGPMKQSFDHHDAPLVVAALSLNPNLIPPFSIIGSCKKDLLHCFTYLSPSRYATCTVPPFDCGVILKRLATSRIDPNLSVYEPEEKAIFY